MWEMSFDAFGNEFHHLGNEFPHFCGNEFRSKRAKKKPEQMHEALLILHRGDPVGQEGSAYHC